MATVDISDDELKWLIQRRAQEIVKVAAQTEAEGPGTADALRALIVSVHDLEKSLPVTP